MGASGLASWGTAAGCEALGLREAGRLGKKEVRGPCGEEPRVVEHGLNGREYQNPFGLELLYWLFFSKTDSEELAILVPFLFPRQ